jgi:hypothetical protein
MRQTEYRRRNTALTEEITDDLARLMAGEMA